MPTPDATSSSMNRFAAILWEPQDPINIGSVIRVCRNTGTQDLRLVRPGGWNPDVLLITAPRCEQFIEEHVQRFDTFTEATGGLHRLYALTARGRREKQDRFRVDALIDEIERLADPELRIGFVFGREDAGLPNGVLDRCDGYISLEAAPDYSSMNLGQAVLLVLWSLFKRFGGAAPMRGPQKAWPIATHDQLARMMDDAEAALDTIEFFKGDNREKVLRTLRQCLLRAELDTQELATFWGVFKEVRAHDRRRAHATIRED